MRKLIECATPELALALADYLQDEKGYTKDGNIEGMAQRFSDLESPFTIELEKDVVSWWSNGDHPKGAFRVKTLKQAIEAADKKEDVITVFESNGTEHEIEFRKDGSVSVGCVNIEKDQMEKIIKARRKAMNS